MNLFDIFNVIIVEPMMNILLALYAIIPGHDFGVAVIIFTIFIRMLMWPFVKKQLHQSKAMRKLQPELKRLKKQAKGNKQLEGQQMMELYKKHNVNPFQSIGLLIIQLPLFIGLYHVIRKVTEHRDKLSDFTYSFMNNWSPVGDIVKNPDHFNQKFLNVFDLNTHALGGAGITDITTLFIIALVVFAGFMQFKSSKMMMTQKPSGKSLRQILAEAADGKQADQADMNAAVSQKMMMFMPVFIGFIMLNLPLALVLYYATSTCVAVIQQQFIIGRDEEEMEEIADEPLQDKPKKTKKPSAAASSKKQTNREKKAKNAKIVSSTKTKQKTKSTNDNIIRVTAKPKAKKKRR